MTHKFLLSLYNEFQYKIQAIIDVPKQTYLKARMKSI
jgi:hypothetical protein